MNRDGFVVLALVLLAGAIPPAHADPTVSAWCDLLPVVPSGLDHPRALTFLPDGRILIAERTTGKIMVVKDGALLAQPFTDVAVNYAGERGALGIAAAPDFASSGAVYLFYARAGGGLDTDAASDVTDLRLVRFVANGDVAAGPETLVRSFPLDPLALAHVGGGMRFGPEEALYLGLGDTDAAPSPALLLDDLRGKLLRLDAATGAAWPANLYATDGNAATLPEIFSSGLHDPAYFAAYRLEPPPAPPKIVLSDPGATGDHEINEMMEQKHYGWPVIQGAIDTPAESAYYAAHANYRAPTRLLSPGSARPTGVAASLVAGGDLLFHAIFWGDAAAGPAASSIALGYFVFFGPPTNHYEPFGQGFDSITDLSFPIRFPMTNIPLFDSLFVLSGDALWKVTRNDNDAVEWGSGAGAGIALAHASANPSRGDAVIACALPDGIVADLAIYDLAGRRTRAIASRLTGTTNVRWDGRDSGGAKVRAGIYFARLAARGTGGAATLRIVRLP
jgi:glucose/arabinose dehydrogenase